jgi:hypothetical protein
MIIRLLFTVWFALGICTTEATAQLYFEGMYGDGVRASGIGQDRLVKYQQGYFVWSGHFEPFRYSLWGFIVDNEGALISDMLPGTPDTISEQAGNILVINDTMLIGSSFQQVLTAPGATTGDIVLTCLSPEGQIYWRKVYGQNDRREIPQEVIRCSDGGYAIVGQVVTVPDVNAEVYIVRTDSLGNVLWEQMYGGGQYDAGEALVQTSDGGFLLLGWTYSYGAGQKDWYLIKTDGLGDAEWDQTYGDVNNQSGSGIIDLSDGNFLMCGGGGNGSARMIKIDSQGESIWQQDYRHPEGTGSNYLFTVVSLPDGSIAACGLTNNPVDSDAGWLVKADSEGVELWQRKFNKNEYTDLFYTMLATEDGGFLLGGQAMNLETMSQDAWLLKVDSVGCAYPNCITGVDELEPTKVMVDVWPNPVEDMLNIEIAGSSTQLNLHVFDISGKEMLHFKQYEKRTTIATNQWNSGMYILKGTDEKGRMFSLKIVKQ